MATNFRDVRTEIEDHIKPNGVGAITGQVMQDAMMSLVDASEAELSAQAEDTESKLAQLSQEFEGIKNADFTLNPHIEMVEPTETALAIEPDKFYKWGEVASLALTLNPQTNQRYASQYFFQFTCPADSATSLALPVNIKWQQQPSIEQGKIYQVSIMENLGIISSWGETE